LETAVSAEDTDAISSCLTALDKEDVAHIDEDMLRLTSIGKVVNNVKKDFKSNTTICTLAKGLVSKWKDGLNSKPAAASSSKSSSSSPTEAEPERKSGREKKAVVSYSEDSMAATAAEGKPKAVPKGPKITVESKRQPIPQKNAKGELVFHDYPNFRPNLTPEEVLRLGSFGGTYFRPIKSSVTGLSYKDMHKELPESWIAGLDAKKYLTSSTYITSVNKYNQSCGGDLEMWETSGWITEVDPYGWFQWYCRFYQGRRCSDDARQISRGLGVIGPKGRWRGNLINKCLASTQPPEKSVVNASIGPKVRQLLQHWGYTLTLDDLLAAKKSKKL